MDFNPDYAIGFVVRGVIERKSGYLEIEAISSRNRNFIGYFGFNASP